jgi:hypothetical protein
MRGVRHITCLLAVAVAAAAGGCAGEDPAQGLADGVDKARAAKTLSSLQTALVTLSVVQVESGGASVQDLAAALQAKDPTNRYTTAVPTTTGVVQVLGGGGGPVMLVAMSDPGSQERPAQFVGVWQGSGTTMYYAATTPPAYTTAAPAGPGWAATPPQ